MPTDSSASREGTSPLIRKLVDLIREEIEASEPGSKLPPEVSLGEKYGVARRSVRAALDVLAADGTVTRIQGKGTFAASGRQSAELYRQPVKRLGLVNWFGYNSPQGEDDFYLGILRGIMDATFSLNIELAVAGGSRPRERTETCYRLSDDSRIDGLMLIAITNQALLNDLAARGKPICLLDHYPETAQIDSIRFDSHRASELAVEHLARLGHRRIAYLCPHKETINPHRLAGFMDAMKQNRLAVGQNQIIEARPTLDGGTRGAGHLLSIKTAERPTAVIAFSPAMARGAIRAIRDFGLRVPEDISVVAGGGHTQSSSEEDGELTSITFDPVRLGSEAVSRICLRIDNPQMSVEDMMLPVELHIGTSTAPLS